MKLLEIVPGKDTDPAATQAWIELGGQTLGKGVVICKDTPNFIANRVGVYGMMALLKRALDEGFAFDEIDAIFGEPMGRPRSAIFGTADLSGIDVLMHVSQGVYDSAPDDEEREVFALPPLLREMASRGWLGNKSGQGFYKRTKGPEGRQTLVLDPKTLEYRPRETYRFASIEAVKHIEDVGARAAGLLKGDDRAARFARAVTLDLFTYAANRIPEIADSPADVDDAMRWGYFWSQGPFQTFDAVGVRAVERMLREDGRPVPHLVERMLERGDESFYKRGGSTPLVVVPASLEYAPLPASPAHLTAASLIEAGRVIKHNKSARLLDMGDGIALLQFDTKLNSLDTDIIALTREALDRAAGDYRGLVIGNDAADFSVGANLGMVLMGAQAGAWDQLDAVTRGFQDMNMAIKYSTIPVVVAGAGRTLGGGCEVVMHGSRARVAAEYYCGLVECGVGLVPAGGGCKELLIRVKPLMAEHGPFPVARKVFEMIAFASVATSAKEARKMGFLRGENLDKVSLDRERLLFDAKADAIALAETPGGYKAPEQAILFLAGPGGRGVIAQQLDGFHKTKMISDHDVAVNTKLAWVLTGGDKGDPITPASEQFVLDLEREAFLSLAGMEKTQQRMEHTLKVGKPLRN